MGSLSAPLAPGGGREGGPDPVRGPLPGPGRLASAARLGGAQTLPRGQEGPECVQSTLSQPLDSVSAPFTWVNSSGHTTSAGTPPPPLKWHCLLANIACGAFTRKSD